MVSYYFISKRLKYISVDRKKYNLKFLIFEKYINKVNDKLTTLGNPFGINLKVYILIKYILSVLLFLLIFFRSRNISLAFLLFIICFLLPDILVNIFQRLENVKIINEISNIVYSLILSLSANMSLYNSMKISINSIRYKRFAKEYEVFVNNYKMYNFNIQKAVEEFKLKFNSYEFNMFISILIECEKQGNILENLEVFSETLEVMSFKFQKLKSANRVVFVSFSTVISMINIFIIVMYPIFTQISSNLIKIFK